MALKYLLPGMLLLVGFQVWPIVYTAATAFTNYGDGHLLTKQEATANIIANSVQEVEGAPRYRLSIAVPQGQDAATGDLTFLLTDPRGSTSRGPSRASRTCRPRASRRRRPARSPPRRASPS